MSTKIPTYAYPPDFDKAHRHRLANRIFKGVTSDSTEQCECCHRRLGEEKVQTECNMDPKQLSFLGPGVPLFFLFIRFSIILLALMTVIFSAFCLYSNVTSTDCDQSSSCLSDGFNQISIVNKQNNTSYLSIQSYLALGYVVVAIIFFHYLRYQARKLQQECDQIVDSPSDYAIIIRGMPPGSTEQDVQDMIQMRRKSLTPEQLEQTDNAKVVKIIMSYYLRPYVEAIEKNKQNWKQYVKENKVDEFVPEELPTPKDTSQIAIVVFDRQVTKDYFIHEASCTQSILRFFCTPCIPVSELTIKGKQIGIQRAPEPDEINWTNAGITMSGAICRKVAFGLISFMILVVGGVAQYGLAILNKQATSDIAKTIFQFANPVIVMVWNSIILSSLEFMTQKQRNQTVTQFQAVLLVKVTLFQFFNAGVFVVGTKIAANYETFNISNGIIGQITTIMILNAITPNVINFIKKYFEIANRSMLFLAKRGWLIMNQVQVNKLSTGHIINMPKRYAYLLKTLILTALYAPAVPAVVPLAMVGFILLYFSQKYLMSCSYSMPHNISSMTFRSAMELLQYFLITFALGQFLVYAYFYNYQVGNLPLDWLVVILLSFALAIMNSALPMDAINQKLFPIESSSRSQLKYTEVENQFEVTYDMFNPAYKTNRVRNNNKDILRELLNNNKIEDNNDMAHIMSLATTENHKSMTRQPLLGAMVSFPGERKGNVEIEMELRKEYQYHKNTDQSSVPTIKLNNIALQNSGLKQEQIQRNSAQIGEKDIAQINSNSLMPPKVEVKKKQSLRFKIFEFKEVKPSQRTSYKDLVSKIMKKTDPAINQEPKESLLTNILDPDESNTLSPQNNRQSHDLHNPGPVSSPQLYEEQQPKITNSELAFPEPDRQEKGTYDPIKVKGSYRKFFNNPDKMLSKEGNYLNSKLIVDYIGRPFSSILKEIQRANQQALKTQKSYQDLQKSQE